MGHAAVYTWPKAATTAVSLLHTTSGAGSISLNGTLSTPEYHGQYVPFVNQYRTVSLTSVNDLHLVNVTITGTLRGAVVSETRAGPTSNTVETTQLFDTVTSVTVDGAVTAMSVGTGTTGQTAWFTYDPYVKSAYMTCACVATATINYSLQLTSDDVQTNASPTVFTPVSTLTSATGSILAAVTPLPTRYANIIINSSSGNGAVTATFIQQGVSA